MCEPLEKTLDKLSHYHRAGWIDEETMLKLKRFFVERERERAAMPKQQPRSESLRHGMMELFD